MKRILLVLLVLNVFSSFSQGALKGDHIIEATMSVPNLPKFVSSYYYLEPPKNITSRWGLAPFGIRYSYMLNDEISIGVDLIGSYNRYEILTNEETLVDGEYQILEVKGVRNEKHLRVQARVNYFFLTYWDRIDSYIGLGAGSNNRWINTTTETGNTEILKGADATLIPISFRLCYGFRYYFSYRIGVTAEVGFGGPILALGFVAKL